ncbi:MAG: hypothetical protein JWR19_1855 [Pedosphaera sp.]|nr:hypothetical protein [Pedosphaera sp.]
MMWGIIPAAGAGSGGYYASLVLRQTNGLIRHLGENQNITPAACSAQRIREQPALKRPAPVNDLPHPSTSAGPFQISRKESSRRRACRRVAASFSCCSSAILISCGRIWSFTRIKVFKRSTSWPSS